MPARPIGTAGAAAVATSADSRWIVGCLPDARIRGRVQTALRGHATIQWLDSFEEVRRVLEGGERPATVVIALADQSGGAAASFAQGIRESMTGTAVVVCCDLSSGGSASIALLAQAGVHDVLFIGMDDERFATRTVILGAAVAAAADVAMRALRRSVPDPVLGFVEAAVRHPRELQRVNDIARALHIPRQTLSRWCREHSCVPPETLVVWARLCLVAALFENTPWTLETIARELAYGSPSALRNRIRAYTGMTAMQIKARGLDGFVRILTENVGTVQPKRELAQIRDLAR